MLIAPFLGTVQQVQSVWHTEVASYVGILTAVGVLLGLLVSRGVWIRTVVLAALLTLAADVMFQGGSDHRDVLFGVFGGLPVAAEPMTVIAIFSVALSICWLMRRYVLEVLGAGFAVALVTSLILPAGPTRHLSDVGTTGPPSTGTGPLIVHLVLDEHIGVEGLPPGIPGAEELRRRLLSFYDGFGFRVYARIYSVYYDTVDSLPNLLNFSTSDSKRFLVSAQGEHTDRRYTMVRNAYFDLLKQLGYRVHVYESDYLDYCRTASPVTDCVVYPSWGFDASRDALALAGRIGLLRAAHVNHSLVYHVAKNTVYKRVRRVFPDSPPMTWERGQTAPLNSMETLNRLRRDLSRGSAGDAYFAHLLLPHWPYVFDSECRIRQPGAWRWDLDPAAYPSSRLGGLRLEHYIQYFEQVRCLYAQIGALLQQLRDDGLLHRSIVMIHGDHGSRITERIEENWQRQDYIDMYSTLFALRAPGVEPGRDDTRRSLSQLFNEFWLGRSEVADFVFVEGRDRLKRVSLSDVGWDPQSAR